MQSSLIVNEKNNNVKNESSLKIINNNNYNEESPKPTAQEKKEVFLSKKRKGSEMKNAKKISKRNAIKLELEQYTDEECSNDLKALLDNSKLHNFMFVHFPKAYTQYEILTNIKKLAIKRQARKIFIPPENLSKTNFFLFNFTKKEIDNNNLPITLWKPNEKITEDEISNFFYKIKKIWPFDKCPFKNEDILEFLMMNQYNTNYCLTQINECVSFCQNRLNEVRNTEKSISHSTKEVKQYSLRKKKV